VIQLTLTLKMTTAQAVETSVTVNNNSPIQDFVHPDDQTQPTLKNKIAYIAVHEAGDKMKQPQDLQESVITAQTKGA